MKRILPLLFLLALVAGLFGLTGCDTSGNAMPAAEEFHKHETHQGESGHTVPEHKVSKRHDDADHDQAHAGENQHDEEVVRLDEQELTTFGIKTAQAGPGKLATTIELPGEIRINSDWMVHIVPRISGIVREVYKKLGDPVQKGEVLAELESRELAELKVGYLSALERLNLAKELFMREERLWKKQVAAEQDYLAARKSLAEARITLRSAEQKLHALGFSEKHLARKQNHPDITFTRYQVTAPLDSTVIEKHVSLGETVKGDTGIFVLADLSTVWVDISVYQKDLPAVRPGLPVTILAGHGLPPAKGRISYVGPIVGEKTRTALSRVVLDNRDGRWRPGMFITARITTGTRQLPLVVPRSALQTFEEKQVLFVRTDRGFEPRPVATGLASQKMVEIVSGLAPGEEYVHQGAFTLKAQLTKGAFGAGHNH